MDPEMQNVIEACLRVIELARKSPGGSDEHPSVYAKAGKKAAATLEQCLAEWVAE